MIDAEALKRDVAIETVIGAHVALKRAGNSDELLGLCPFHKEKTPSFTVTRSKGLYRCFGCGAGGDVFEFIQRIEGISFQDAIKRVAESAGHVEASAGRIVERRASNAQRGASRDVVAEVETVPQKVTAEYFYTDEHGEILYRVQRVEPGKNGKSKEFRQARPHPIDGCWVTGISAGFYRKRGDEWRAVKDDHKDGDDELPEVRRVLFALPDILATDTVYVVEGEKDCLTLRSLGFLATTNSGGASNKWLPEYSEALRGKRVVILPDQDEPGRKRGGVIAEALKGIAAQVAVFDVPKGKDVTDWFDADSASITDRLAGIFAEVDEKRREAELEEKGLWSVSDIVENFRGGLNAFLDPLQRPKGLSTGFKLIDKRTLGLHAGELTILAARPAMGKTALALNIAQNVAERGGVVAVFSMEMSRSSLIDRAVCSRARLDQLRFRRGDYTAMADERGRLSKALAELADMPLFIDDQPAVSMAYIRKKCEALKAREGLSLVVVDYLQLMGGKARENRQQEVNALSRGMKLLSRQLNAPFLVLSQLSRAPDQRPGDNIPQLSDLRDSGGIEQDADAVWFIYRAEVYDKQKTKPELKGKADLVIAKQRNGGIGRIPLTFNAAATRFDDAATEIREED